MDDNDDCIVLANASRHSENTQRNSGEISKENICLVIGRVQSNGSEIGFVSNRGSIRRTIPSSPLVSIAFVSSQWRQQIVRPSHSSRTAIIASLIVE